MINAFAGKPIGDDPSIRGAASCRHCGAPLELTVVDLGKSPLCQTVLTVEQLEQREAFYPLHVRACEQCWLVQIGEFVPAGGHLHRVRLLLRVLRFLGGALSPLRGRMTERLRLGPDSFVVELASNDGYLLQHFLPKGIPVWASSRRRTSLRPRSNGEWRRLSISSRPISAQQLVGGARPRRSHPRQQRPRAGPGHQRLRSGRRAASGPSGTATFEFPHVAKLIEHLEYDTIYHEHFSYFSLHAIRAIFGTQGLDLVDVEELPSHGGSLRVFLQPCGSRRPAVGGRRPAARTGGCRRSARLRDVPPVRGGRPQSKHALLEFLIGLKREGKHVVGYGAPGKGNTLLNYCGIRTDFLDYTVDRNPYKQGKHTPGTHIPIHAPERIAETRPDVILILPWNLASEIREQLAYTAEWGARLAIPIPTVRFLDDERGASEPRVA